MTTFIPLEIDHSYSGIRRIDAPDSSFSSGVELPVCWPAGVHIQEHLGRSQSNLRFSCLSNQTEARNTSKGHFIAAQLGLRRVDTGAVWSRGEWRFMVEQRDSRSYSHGIRRYEYICADFSSLIRTADVSSIPRGSQAGLGVVPGDSGGPPQTTLKGPQGYMLSKLLADLIPEGCDFLLNAPDVPIERLPDQGDGIELLSNFLSNTGYVYYWDLNKLLIEQHEKVEDLYSIVLTGSNVLEVRQEMGQRRQSIESVVIERPSDYNTNENSVLPADRNGDLVNSNGSVLLPNEARTEDETGVEETLYRIHENWSPPQTYVFEEPGPILYAFDDPAYNVSGWTDEQLAGAMTFFPGQVQMTPGLRWTRDPIYGPQGFKRYFIVPVIALKVDDSNLEYVDIFVVAATGYLATTGSFSRTTKPIPGVPVLLRGRDTGATISGTTNADGYARIPTGGVRDRWYASAYTIDDTYLANKSDAWTAGHPYDDDPLNDQIGPSNLNVVEDTWQIEPMRVDFLMTWKTGQGDPADSIDGTDGLYANYKGRGGGRYGGAIGNTLNIGEFNDLDIDSANISSDIQGSLLAEQIIDRSEEEQDVVVPSLVFSGETTRIGKAVKLSISADDEIETVARVVTREIHCNGTSILESSSTAHDSFNSELERYYANKFKTENTQTRIAAQTQKALNMLERIQGQFGNDPEKLGL